MYRTSLRYGWKPDLPDHRDIIYSASKVILKSLPPKVDLRGICPSVYDQGQLGSCTGNAIAGAFQFELMKQNAPVFIPSRLFIYYNERVIEDTVDSDNGAQIRDGFKSIGNVGVCPETMWPYVISEFAQKPDVICYTDALKHVAIQYNRITQNLNQMKSCLADGYPFVFGFTVYDSFESQQVAQSGILNMPKTDEKIVGGHAVVAVGYDDSNSRFIVRNSWGTNWGLNGYFTIPYDYLTNENLSDDFWTLRLVSSNPALRQPTSKSDKKTKSKTGKQANRTSQKEKSATEPILNPADVSVTFFNGNSNYDYLSATLKDESGNTISSGRIDGNNAGPIHFDNVPVGYSIDIDAYCLGSAQLSINIPTSPSPASSYGPGYFYPSFTC